MEHLTAHHLRFTLEAETLIELNEFPGSALRGMLFHALRGPARNPALGFCTQRHLKSCADCALVAVCPVASLVSTLNPAADRGRDVPRPYAILPPLGDKSRYEPGEGLNFGLTLFGQALNLFPYVVMALRQAGRAGLGKRLPRPEANGRAYRGRFIIRTAQAINLLTGEVQDILQAGSPLVRQPALPVTHRQVLELSGQLLRRHLRLAANGHSGEAAYLHPARQEPIEVSLVLKTPLRIVDQERLLKTPRFTPIFQRLLERLASLSREFGGVPPTATGPFSPVSDPSPADRPAAPFDKDALLALSDQVELVENGTTWADIWSYSSRQGGRTPIGGLLGRATYRARPEVWATLLPYLLWGSVIQVGKSVVKGNGCYGVVVGREWCGAESAALKGQSSSS